MPNFSAEDQIDLDKLQKILQNSYLSRSEKSEKVIEILEAKTGQQNYSDFVHFSLSTDPWIYVYESTANKMGASGIKSILEISAEKGRFDESYAAEALKKSRQPNSDSSPEMKDYSKSSEYLNLVATAIEKTLERGDRHSSIMICSKMGEDLSNRLPEKTINALIKTGLTPESDGHAYFLAEKLVFDNGRPPSKETLSLFASKIEQASLYFSTGLSDKAQNVLGIDLARKSANEYPEYLRYFSSGIPGIGDLVKEITSKHPDIIDTLPATLKEAGQVVSLRNIHEPKQIDGQWVVEPRLGASVDKVSEVAIELANMKKEEVILRHSMADLVVKPGDTVANVDAAFDAAYAARIAAENSNLKSDITLNQESRKTTSNPELNEAGYRQYMSESVKENLANANQNEELSPVAKLHSALMEKGLGVTSAQAEGLVAAANKIGPDRVVEVLAADLSTKDGSIALRLSAEAIKTLASEGANSPNLAQAYSPGKEGAPGSVTLTDSRQAARDQGPANESSANNIVSQQSGSPPPSLSQSGRGSM